MQSSRPDLAASYGVLPADQGAGLVPWPGVETRLTAARNYWIATVGADARPHSTPIWGVWLHGSLYFGTDPNSKKAANMAANPYVVVHLESGDDVVVLHCRMATESDTDIIRTVFATYRTKYSMPDDFEFEPVLVASPDTAFAWDERGFPGSATRFVDFPRPS
ncbi:MAG: pyridoxamine 5'-phosphate oxidase family protein [Actinomycetota bacterium]|nr:pyridoxamine 5'-phosphate oxidase family protein [Actinomycetota bacterium]